MVGASGFEPLASRTRTVRSIRAELRPASHHYTIPAPFYKQMFSKNFPSQTLVFRDIDSLQDRCHRFIYLIAFKKHRSVSFLR